MKRSSATRIEAILHIDLDDLDGVTGGKKRKKTTQEAHVNQTGSTRFDLGGVGSVSSFLCPGSGSSIRLSVNQTADVDQEDH